MLIRCFLYHPRIDIHIRAYMSSTPTDSQSGSRSTNHGPRGRGRGGKRWTDSRDTKGLEQQRKPQQPRPTHFLALPLHNHQRLRECVASYQAVLMGDPIKGAAKGNPAVSSLVDGLDTSIIIDPRRLHLTLGVMSLEPVGQGQHPLDPRSSTQASNSDTPPMAPKKTVATALELLASLQPRIAEILEGSAGVKVLLDQLDVLKAQKIQSQRSPDKGPQSVEEGPPKVGAGVLFLGPSPSALQSAEGVKLMRVCNFVHQEFRRAGYITETRPLKLHCTILNTSHRRPRRNYPFSYTDVHSQPISGHLSLDHSVAGEALPVNTNATEPPRTHSGRLEIPPPLAVKLGEFGVGEIQLWIMGSHGPNNEYTSCGGISLL